MNKAATAAVSQGRAQMPEAQPDVLDAAIAETDRQYTIKMSEPLNIGITTDDGRHSGLVVRFPGDLDYEILAAAAAAVLSLGQQIIAQKQKPATGLTLVRGTLPHG